MFINPQFLSHLLSQICTKLKLKIHSHILLKLPCKRDSNIIINLYFIPFLLYLPAPFDSPEDKESKGTQPFLEDAHKRTNAPSRPGVSKGTLECRTMLPPQATRLSKWKKGILHRFQSNKSRDRFFFLLSTKQFVI